MNKISIPLSDDYKLIVEQNSGEFDKEIFVGVETPDGKYMQDLVVVRPSYTCSDDNVIFDADKFEVLVYADSKREDYTNLFTVPRATDDDE